MQNYIINNRVLSHNHDLAKELIFNPKKNYLFDLSYLGILDISGEKAFDFLQGQVTSDIKKMDETSMHPGAMCNLKGRILTLFQACKYHGLKLILPEDLLKDTQQSLQQAAMLSRVKLQEQTETSLLGYYCQNPDDLVLPKDLPCFKFYLPENDCPLFLIFVNQEQKTKISATFLEKDQFKGSLAWHTLTLIHKSLDIYPETHGEFLPHRLDLHLTPYLNFEKGCYKGQEIIARTHYRATIKHELSLFTLESDIPLYSGQKITSGDKDQEIGEIIDYAPINEQQFIVAASMLKDRPADLKVQN